MARAIASIDSLKFNDSARNYKFEIRRINRMIDRGSSRLELKLIPRVAEEFEDLKSAYEEVGWKVHSTKTSLIMTWKGK